MNIIIFTIDMLYKYRFTGYNDTSFELDWDDAFTVHLNVDDLEKLNVTYIATSQNLDDFSNRNLEFIELCHVDGFKI